MDDSGDPSSEEAPKAIKPTSKEFRKTWGFRRTTIAKREGAGDAEVDAAEPAPQPQPQLQHGLSLRRSGRQPKRTERVEEFLTTVRRRGRRSAPASLEDCTEPASCPVTDAETASEGSVESASESKGGSTPGAGAAKGRLASPEKAKAGGEEDDTSDSDSDGLTLKELQNRLRREREREPAERPASGAPSRRRKQQREEDPPEPVGVEAGAAAEQVLPGAQEPEAGRGAVSQVAEEGVESEAEGRVAPGVEEEPRNPGRPKPECETYDPSTLYCICRQPHNSRFMICCDRCEEWFHGDCVGISENRGRLLERNGEDYICPNCTILQVQAEPDAEAADQQDTGVTPGSADGTALMSMGTVEQRSSEDQGIKGRIEKAAHPSGKKKLKIFQPVVEAPGAARCIGPGCSSVAQPDSVYCSNSCILKHAAATMKLLSSGKEQTPKPKEKMKPKAGKLRPPTWSVQAGIKISSVHKRPAPETKENPAKKVAVAPPRGEAMGKEAPSESTPSWASDHNYNAVKPEKSAALSSSLLCKSVKEDRRVEEKVTTAAAAKKTALPGASASRQTAPRSLLPKKSPLGGMAATRPVIKKAPSGCKGAIPKRPWLSATPSGGASAARQAGPTAVPATATSKKAPGAALAGAVRKPAATSASAASPATGRLGAVSPAPSQPNSQIRQNIRRSLKEILWKRVNDSDDLVMTESEVGKVALHIEKELFGLFQVTDSRYKSKYRSIMFNLKDPKNQGLFHRVLREEISLAKLVRMKPEELVSKELSTWKERPRRSAVEPRARLHNGGKRVAAVQEAAPDMEDSPPVSDSEEQQEAVRAAPERSTAPALDVFSSMLKDTTSQHRAHLFDLNCKICTGQVASSEEPVPKKQKLSASAKKDDLKSRDGSAAPDPAASPADDEVPEAPPGEAAEPDLEGTSQPHLERKPFPGPPGDGRPEPSPLEGLSTCPAPAGGGVVTTVTVSGRDPRTAPGGSGTGMASAAAHLDSPHATESKSDVPKPAVTSVTVPKSILAKPSSSSSPDPRYLSVPPSPGVSVSGSRSPPEGDTSLFLSRLSAIWKGFINMQGVAKFVTKAYPVSGSLDYLSEDLPDTIHIGGRIAPRTVWDYVGKLKSSVSKELCLIRFHPATEEEEVAYISLYSYFSSRGRFGVVANNNRHVKDLYLIPLSAKDPVPSKLLPFEGPGLESPRPNIILGLVICQKIKRPSNTAELDKGEERRSRLQDEADISAGPKVPAAPLSDKKPPRYPLCSADPAVSTTPPASPPPPPPLPEPPVSKVLPPLKPGSTGTVSVPAAPAAPPAAAPASKAASPLEHILQALFGKKKSFDTQAKESGGAAPAPHQDPKAPLDSGAPAAPLLDPIVQQFGQFSKEKAPLEEEDDRPYDPEEEYGPERAFGAQLAARPGAPHDMESAPDAAEREEVAYDPEDETILEEAKVTVDDLPNRMCAGAGAEPTERAVGCAPDAPTPSLVEQQKMLEELNKQIEEQKRQLEEQEEALRQQRAAVGASMAHFSVSDALMSPPPKAALTKGELLEPEQQQAPDRPAVPAAPNPMAPVAQQSGDARQRRDPRQARRLAAESSEAGSAKPPAGSSQPGPAARGPPAGAPGVQGPAQALEEGEATPPPWVPGEKPPLMPTQDSQRGEYSGNPGQLPMESVHPVAAGDGLARPARRVLLPTPPSTALQPGFALQSDGQNFCSPAGRDPFPSPAFTAQERPLGGAPYESPRHSQCAGKSNGPAAGAELGREPLARAGEGPAQFPLPGQKGGAPPPPFQGQRESARPFGVSALHGSNFPGPRGPGPSFAEENVVPSDGPRGPPPARFGAQKGPIPSLFAGQHGPPPYGDARGPSPPFLGGPRGAAPTQFEERKDLHGEQRDFQDPPYSEAPGPPAQFEGPERAPCVGSRGPVPFQCGGQRRPLLSQLKGPRGGPPPSQFGGQRGPPPGHFVGPRGPHPGQFEGPRGQAPAFMPGPRGVQPQQFEEQRVNSPPRFAGQRAPAPLPFAGPRGSAPFPENEQTPARFHFQGQSPQVLKPGPRPLLELPSHPPQHRKDRWDEAGPGSSGQGPEADAQWVSPDFRETKGHEYRGQAFEGRPRERFEAGPKDKPVDEPEAQVPESRQGRGFEDRRRERERGRNWSRERDWERSRDWDRHRDKDAGRDWDRGRERSANRDRERGRSRDRSRSRNRDRERDRDRRRDRDREKARDRERGRDRDRRDQGKSKESARDPKAEAASAQA